MIKKIVLFFALFLLTLPVFYQLIRSGFYPMQDDLQVLRVDQMVKCLKDLQIPCRWVPDMGYGYGYPQFNYYSPLPYYIGAILNLSGIQIIDAVKILFILGFSLSALTMFIFLKAFLNDEAAIVGSALYTYIPVKATQVYVRGSLSEFWAFIFMPLLFWSSFQLIKSGKVKYLIWFGLSFAMLITTHNLTVFIFTPILIIWILALIFLEKNRKAIGKVFFGGLLGLGLSSFYLLPAIFERQYVHLETLLGGYFDFRQHFVSIGQLLFSNYFNYGSSVFGLRDEVSLSTGIIHWIAALFALILSFIFLKRDKKLAIIIWALSALEIFVLLLMHPKSEFVYHIITPLAFLQFPWRFLVPSAFLLSTLSACAIFIIYKYNKTYAKILSVVIILSVVVLHGNFFKPKDWFNISDNDKLTGENWERQLTTSIFDYLPIYGELPPNRRAPDLPEVLEGEAVFLSYQKGSNYQIGEVDVKKEALIRVPLFDFPGMEVLVDDIKIPHINNDCRGEDHCFGLITFPVNIGVHTIKVRLANTPIRTVGNAVTLASLTILSFLIFLNYGRKKYY